MNTNWLFLYSMTDYSQHDQHVWDYYFWLNIRRALAPIAKRRHEALLQWLNS